ncbi:MAG: TonB-dependent receptor [Candidatus Andeanibacterium colombiense]|uniref:TonB-dependent receptor n=1 Tax=Candidatus Andeanibacterium colombiense TaxID=3121345 RepID=A0AAJ6BQX5_9SPHN|nr:MAG: TonB-dependent receptor [Sphingomonadaceae bacterium]
MKIKYLLAASIVGLSASVALPTAAFAQETTSAISGQVVDDNGTAVAGATVTVTHVASGTTSVGTTNASGTYTLRGLRPGGPYTVTVDADTYAEQTVNDVALTLGEVTNVPIKITGNAIVVTAASVGASSQARGSQSSFDSDQIAGIVSARRDVRDIIRRDPMSAYNPNIGGVTIAGGNIRTQRFSVDGLQMQDSFGLNYGGLPSTRGIVSIEAIDQLTVKAAPFDISEGNFQGGAVNVVLKSGTNDIHGSGFYTWGGDWGTGNLTRDNQTLPSGTKKVGKTTIFKFKNWGVSLSGPLIKDKLFIYAAYEDLTEGAANTYGPTDGSAANVVPNLTQAQIDNVIRLFGSAGYDDYNVGNVPTALSETDRKASVKLDWNITDGQRLSATYIHHENGLPNFATGAATGSNSTATPYIQLQSNQYQLTEFTNAVSAQLNSQWSSNFSTEVRGAYKYYERGQTAWFGADYAQFAVCLDPTSQGGYYDPANASASAFATKCVDGSPIIRMGPDTPRQANLFHSYQTSFNANAQLALGTHNIKFEADYVRNRIYNLFVYGGSSLSAGATGGANGAYYFDSLADFQNRTANELSLNIPSTGNKADGAVDWVYEMYTAGLQDTWKPFYNFTVNGGVRYDWYSSDKPQLNNALVTRYSSLYPGLDNTSSLDGRGKLQPRIGFNWTPIPSLRISGGVGLFAGGLSDVFISNNFSNSGAAINDAGAALASVDIVRTGPNSCIERASNVVLPTGLCAAALNNVGGSSPPQAVVDYIKANATVSAAASTNLLDPDFKIPAQWKYNLSAVWRPEFGDTGLGSGWTFRADVLHSEAQQAVRWIDLRAQPLVTGGIAQVAPDGRPRYAGIGGSGNWDVELTNTTKGQAWVWSAGLSKMLGAFDLSASYTHQDVKDVAGILTSSSVNSSYAIATSDPNSGGDYGRSSFEVTHTFRANLDFKHRFFGDNETRFNVNWELRSGQPFSVTMNDSAGRNGVFGTAQNTTAHLLYVPDFSLTPTNGGLTYGIVTFSNDDTRKAVQALVEGTKLKDYQGGIAPKNLLTGPWYNKVDLNLAQQLPVPLTDGGKFTLMFGIENFLNLLNRDWGSYQDYGVSQTVVTVACNGAPSGGQTCPGYKYSSYAAPTTQTYSKPSLYAIRVGVRVDF